MAFKLSGLEAHHQHYKRLNVKNSDYIDSDTRKKLPKIAITNIERVLGTPDARKLLGVDVKSGQLFFFVPEEEAIARLAIMVSDVANKQIKVTNLDTKDQRVKYAEDIVSRPLPKPRPPDKSEEDGTDAAEKKTATKRLPHDRKTLIPRRLNLEIHQTRINKICSELQQLDVKRFVNSCSVMLRVFVEMSIDEYAQRHKISLRKTIPSRTNSKGVLIPKVEMEFKLREKLMAIADHFQKHDICTRDELRGVRTIISNKDHVLSVEGLNAYVHNKDFNPSDSDLKNTWDNLEIFIQRIWST